MSGFLSLFPVNCRPQWVVVTAYEADEKRSSPFFSTSLVNCMFEERALSTCRRTVPFWLRNVDDTFTTVRHDEIDAFHHNPDGRNTDIQFTRDEVRKRKLCCTTGLDGYHLSGFFCDFQEAFETEKKPRDFFGVLLVTLIFATRLLISSWRTCFLSRLLYP